MVSSSKRPAEIMIPAAAIVNVSPKRIRGQG